MRFFVVDENMAPADNINIGYFHSPCEAFRVMSESDDRRVLMFELNHQTKRYVATMVWEYPYQDEDEDEDED